ncbi:WHG domain-containing protein [Actinocrispum sp. NPDC049592]|uniref:TetR/AcrR family transcriptional regulator n=1 Tax=Actinocrispum sp. NPDC049592 TaxID=3154835 RepID=UPI003425BE6C
MATRPTGKHHGDLRNALEQAALELVAQQGTFTLAEASRRAGVSVAAPYKHYADKDALLASIAQKGYEQQYERFSKAIESAADPVEQLAAFAAAYVQFAADNRALFEITFNAGLKKTRYYDLAVAGNRVLTLLRGPAAQLRDDPHSAIDLIHTVGAVAHGFAAFLLEGVLGDPADALESTMERAREATRRLI